MSNIKTGNGTEKITNYEMTYYDKEDPRSLYNISPGIIRELIQTNTHLPNLTKMSENELQKLAKPTPIVSRLRLAFWKEYERAQFSKSDMIMENCYRGVCTREYFFDLVDNQKNLCAVAWIIRPPSNYVVAMEEALHHGIERMREILDFPLWETKIVVNAKGIRREKKIPNIQTANLILKTVQMLDTRVKGAVVHRVKHDVNVKNDPGKPDAIPAETVGPDGQAYMEQRIRELEQDLTNNTGVIKNQDKDDYVDYRALGEEDE